MKLVQLFVLALAAGFSSFSVLGGQTATLTSQRSAATAAVTPGKWHAGWKKCKAYAEKHGVPMIAVWSNGDSCGHCVGFESSVNSSYFKKWMKTSGIVFMFAYSGDPGDGKVGSDFFHWCRKNTNTAYPFVRIYWPKGKVDVATIGDKVDGNKDGTTGGKKAVAFFKGKLSKFKPNPTPSPTPTPGYKGGTIEMEDTETDRLEAEIGTTGQVTIPLMRDEAVASVAASNRVVAVYPDGKVVTNVVEWAKDETEKGLVIDIPSTLTTPDAKIGLVVLDDAGKVVGKTNHVTMVEQQASSPTNPLWLNETIDWGDWSMDLDAVKAKAGVGEAVLSGARLQAAPPGGYAFVFFTGALWCPWCQGLDAGVFETDEFKTWARDNRAVFALLDNPKRSETDQISAAPYVVSGIPNGQPPTLLRYAAGTNSFLGRMMSGASYLSRKGIAVGDTNTPDTAEWVLQRNHTLGYRGGEYCAPEAWRSGYPTLILLKRDGTVAGRFKGYSENDAAHDHEYDTAENIARLNDLLLLAEDGDERANYVTTTPNTIVCGGATARTKMQINDSVKAFRLASTPNGKVTFSAKAYASVDADEPIDRELVLTLVQLRGDGTQTVLDCATNGTVTCAATAGAENLYLKVSAYVTAKKYGPASTVFFAQAESLVTLEPAEVKAVYKPERDEVALSVQSNVCYRLTGMKEDAAFTELFEPVEGEADLWTAKATDVVTLTKDGEGISYQIWNPGTVGFVTKSASASESAGFYTVRLVRSGGMSGRAVAKLAFNAEKSTALDNLIVLPGDFTEEIVWEEGDTEVKTRMIEVVDNPYADGDQSFVFDAAASGDAETGILQMKLTLRDNDSKVPGVLAIVETTPSLAKDMCVFARAGDVVDVSTARENGTDGELRATLASSAGVQESLSWGSREAEVRTTSFDVPNAPGKKMTVTLTPAKGVKVDADRRVLSVNILAANAPGFATDGAEVAATRYVPIEPCSVALDAYATSFKKYSGALPSGLSAALKDGALVISGVPKKAGAYTAVYRAYNGKTAGFTVSIAVNVIDPAVVGVGEKPALNPTVAVTRTIADVPVFAMDVPGCSNLVGLVTLTLPRTGHASAKYRMLDGTSVSLSCASWAACDTKNGTLTANLVGTLKGQTIALDVDAFADGQIEAHLIDPVTGVDDQILQGVPQIWSKSSQATDFKGYYTVSLPQKSEGRVGPVLATGRGYMTLKMTDASALRSGKVAYAGISPDGRPFSGAAVLGTTDWCEDESCWSRATLPVLKIDSRNALIGMLQIRPGAANTAATNGIVRLSYKKRRCCVRTEPGVAFMWIHGEPDTGACCSSELDAFGAYYSSTENFVTCCNTTALKFFTLPGLNDAAAELALAKDVLAYPAGNTVGGVQVLYAKATKTAKTKTSQLAASNAKGQTLALSFTLSTGLVSGSFSVGGVKLTYKGVVMPGWGDFSSCGDCGYDEGDPKEETASPFAAGAAWFDDVQTYMDAKGKVRTAKVRRGCPFTIGVVEGK